MALSRRRHLPIEPSAALEYITLEQFIIEEGAHRASETGSFSRLIRDISVAGKRVNRLLQEAALIGVLGSSNKSNVSGDVQKRMDILAHDEFIRCLQRGGECQIVGSEEALTLMSLSGDHIAGRFTVLLDPMDGSDNIDVAAPVGTIFSIFEDAPERNEEGALRTWKGSAQVAAGYLVYGSSAMFVYTSGSGVNGFTLDPEIGEFILSHPRIAFPTTQQFFSINTGLATSWSPALAELIGTFCDPASGGPSLTYRYAGSLVADFHRNLLMGGICIYPGTAKNPDGKLRLTYEANPMAFIAEQAGGSATDGERRILDKTTADLHEHTPLFIGSDELLTLMDVCRSRHQAPSY